MKLRKEKVIEADKYIELKRESNNYARRRRKEEEGKRNVRKRET